MVTVIKKGSSRKDLMQVMKKIAGRSKKKDLQRFCGVISTKKDPVVLQKEWRDEWK
jgi:hypothetical protein